MFFGSAEIAALAARCAEVTGLECRNEGRFLLPVGALYAPVFYCRDYGLIRKGGHGRDVSIFLRICTGYCILVSTSIAGHTSREGGDQRAGKGDRRTRQVVWAGKAEVTVVALESDGAVAGRFGSRFKSTKLTVVKFGKHEKIKAVGDLQLAEDGSKMVPQGLFADTKLLRYFFV